MKVLKICCSEWDNASRDKRELSVCRELGADVLVVQKGEPGDKGRVTEIDGFEVRNYNTRPLGPKFPNSVNRVLALLTWAKYVRKEIKPDIISGHDIPGLFVGWLSNIFRIHKAKLVYDSHEFELGRNKKRSKLALFFVAKLEKFLMKRCVFSIMVNDSIADEVQRIHKLKERPIVVRSTPNRWIIDQKIAMEKREEMLKGFNHEVSTIIMFHGILGKGNGIEDLVDILPRIKGTGLVLLGYQTDAKLIERVKTMAKKTGVSERLLFMPAVPIDELWKYVAAVDIEMMVIEPIVKSHYYVLPNKLFESIQSEVPVIASDLPEMKRIVDTYKVGLTCKPKDHEGICSCVNRLIDDKNLYDKCKKNLLVAKDELCWEKEKQVLISKYKECMSTL